MGPLRVVGDEPGRGQFADLADVDEDVRVLLRLAGLDVAQGHAVLCAPARKRNRGQLGPVFHPQGRELSIASPRVHPARRAQRTPGEVA